MIKYSILFFMHKILPASIRKFTLFTLLTLFSFTFLQAQAPSKFKKGKVKCARVWITDPGELYSTYQISENEISLIKSTNKKITGGLIDDIIADHLETAWPSSLQILSNRVDNPDIVMSYATYKISKFDDKYIIIIPASLNKGMENGWSPQKDVYFVIGESGVSETKK